MDSDEGMDVARAIQLAVIAVWFAAAGCGVEAGDTSPTSEGRVAEQGTILFVESFDDPDFAARGWYDNLNLQLSAVEHIPGSAGSVEFRFLAGATTPTSGGAARRRFAETEAVYIRYWVKYSPNWEGSNQPYHPHEIYLLTNADGDWTGPAYTHLTFYVEQNEGVPLLAIQDSQNIDTANIGVDLTGVTENRAVAGGNGDSDGYGEGDCYSSGGVWYNGKAWRALDLFFSDSAGPRYKSDWHCIEAYACLNGIVEGIAAADGTVRYWYDGQAIIDHDDVVLRTGQHPDLKFNQFLIGPWIGDGSPVDQTFWVDELTVATARTGTAVDAWDDH